MKTGTNVLPKYIATSAIFLSLFIIPFVLFGNRFEDLARSVMEPGANGTLAMIVAAVLLAGDPVLPTPSSLIATLLAAKVGFGPAALVNAASLSLACVLGFAIGRGGGAALARTGRGLPPGFAQWVRRRGLVAVLLCRPVPVLAEASLIIAGAARHEARSLLVWCCSAQALLGVIYAFAGSGWGSEEWNAGAVLFGSVAVPVLGAMVVALSLKRGASRRP